MSRILTGTPRWAEFVPSPECPPGWRTGPPDFVGIGAQRAGTGWWFRTLRQHPRVVKIPGQRKELHYFDRFWSGQLPDDFVEAYHRYFPRPEGSVVGEWTPRYVYDYWSLRLLARAAPDARLLLMLRDPVERFRSGMAKHLRKVSRHDIPPHPDSFAESLYRGAYHDQLRRVFRFFDRGQVLVLQYERCARDPVGQMDATLRFLGLDPFPEEPDRLRGARRRTAHEKPVLTDAMREDLVEHYREDVARVAELCPEIDLSLWRNFS